MPVDMNVQKTPEEYNGLVRNLKSKTEQVQVVNYQSQLNKLLKAGDIELNTKPTTIYLETSKEPSFLEKMANALKPLEVITPSFELGGGKLYLEVSSDRLKMGWCLGF